MQNSLQFRQLLPLPPLFWFKLFDSGIEGRNGSQLPDEIMENNNINGDESGTGGEGSGGGSGVGDTKKTVMLLSSLEKQGSAIDLDIGPPLDEAQTLNYKTIQKILIRMNRLCVQSGFGSNANSSGILIFRVCVV